MKIYTKTGDDGTTGLFKNVRVSKNDLLIECIGCVDELNSTIGIALASYGSKGTLISDILFHVQKTLFELGSELAGGPTTITQMHVRHLEEHIDKLQLRLPELKSFILPGGTLFAAELHHARTMCRRSERRVVGLMQKNDINNLILVYLNRLSDLLFVLARYANNIEDVKDIEWKN